MPKATVSTEEVRHFDLKTCPGGWVELRRLSYGQILARREMASKFSFEIDRRAARRGGDSGRDMKAEMQTINKRVGLWEFGHCIVDHNLDDGAEPPRKLDLHSAADVEQLDPKIGQEIDEYITEMNNYESEEEGNSLTGSEL